MQNWNYEMAEEYLQRIEDPIVRRMGEFFMQRVTLLRGTNRAHPEQDFDLLFYVIVVTDVLKEKDDLRRLLAGDEGVGRWNWPDGTGSA